MKQVLDYTDEFMKQSDWKDLTLMKFCMGAVGVIGGVALPKKARKPAILIAALVFVATYIPLILKFSKIIDSHLAKEK